MMASATGGRNRGKWTRVDRNVPDGWFNYRPYGSPIGSTRIIPVKTPLKETFNTGRRRIGEVMTDYHHGVPIEEELTPTQLVKKLESDGLVLGMVVDLTFTKRYYDPMEFESLGVKHMKIMCPGHEIPNDAIYQRLSTVITDFLQNMDNQEKLIAIHCTHGLNRTGYLVCRYIMEHFDYSAEEAIHAFNQARGYDIERENYLEHIRKGCPPLSPRSPNESVRKSGCGDLPDKHDLRVKIPRISRGNSPSLASSKGHPRISREDSPSLASSKGHLSKIQQEDLRAKIQRGRDSKDSSSRGNPSVQRRRGNRRQQRHSPSHQDSAAGTTGHGRQHVEEREGSLPHVPPLKRSRQYKESTRPDHIGEESYQYRHGAEYSGPGFSLPHHHGFGYPHDYGGSYDRYQSHRWEHPQYYGHYRYGEDSSGSDSSFVHGVAGRKRPREYDYDDWR